MRERVAAFAHSQWSGWMRYLFSKCEDNGDGSVTIPAWAVERWRRQMGTDYVRLPEDEKESDRREADKFLVLVCDVMREALQEAMLLVGLTGRG